MKTSINVASLIAESLNYKGFLLREMKKLIELKTVRIVEARGMEGLLDPVYGGYVSALVRTKI